jgi:hypothetical protein
MKNLGKKVFEKLSDREWCLEWFLILGTPTIYFFACKQNEGEFIGSLFLALGVLVLTLIIRTYHQENQRQEKIIYQQKEKIKELQSGFFKFMD